MSHTGNFKLELEKFKLKFDQLCFLLCITFCVHESWVHDWAWVCNNKTI